MSVALDSTVTAQLDKDSYDSQFAEAKTFDIDEDIDEPAKMCFVTCFLTGV